MEVAQLIQEFHYQQLGVIRSDATPAMHSLNVTMATTDRD